MKVPTIVFSVLGIFLLCSGVMCEKENHDPYDPYHNGNTLPAASSQGMNRLGFEVNGLVWNASYVSVSYREGWLSIDCKKYIRHRYDEHISLQLSGISDTGYYELPYHAAAYYEDVCPSCKPVLYFQGNYNWENYVPVDNSIFKIHITRLDTIHKRIASGRFEFDLMSRSGKHVSIRRGRFDARIH